MRSIKLSCKVCYSLCVMIFFVAGCSGKARDREIKADITIKARDDANFAGVHFFVKNGLVRLVGSCPTPRSRELINQKLKSIHIIDSLKDELIIAPVTLGTSYALKQQADSVLARYPMVSAFVSNTSIMLSGEIGSSELQKLLPLMKKVFPVVDTTRLITIKTL